jgi:hypothetical protein
MDRNTLHHLICFNRTCPQENLIALLAQQLQIEIDQNNQEEICMLFRVIFEQVPADIIEPLLVSSNVFYIMLDKLVDTHYWREEDTVYTVETAKIMIMNALCSFFQYVGPTLGSQMSYYKDLILSYSDKITAVIHLRSDSQLSKQAYSLLESLMQEGY